VQVSLPSHVASPPQVTDAEQVTSQVGFCGQVTRQQVAFW